MITIANMHIITVLDACQVAITGFSVLLIQFKACEKQILTRMSWQEGHPPNRLYAGSVAV